MSEPFDPYYIWLGIRPTHQPPNAYRLLGLDLYESNPDVIENAADRQMSHIRGHQGGKHAEYSQKLLNEISAAKICLLNAGKKADYDAKLRAIAAGTNEQRQAPNKPSRSAPAAIAGAQSVPMGPPEEPLDELLRQPAPAAPVKTLRGPKSNDEEEETEEGNPTAMIAMIGGGAAALLLVVVFALMAFFWLAPNDPEVVYDPQAAFAENGGRDEGDSSTTGDAKTGDSKTGETKTSDSGTGETKASDSETGDSETGETNQSQDEDAQGTSKENGSTPSDESASGDTAGASSSSDSKNSPGQAGGQDKSGGASSSGADPPSEDFGKSPSKESGAPAPEPDSGPGESARRSGRPSDPGASDEGENRRIAFEPPTPIGDELRANAKVTADSPAPLATLQSTFAGPPGDLPDGWLADELVRVAQETPVTNYVTSGGEESAGEALLTPLVSFDSFELEVLATAPPNSALHIGLLDGEGSAFTGFGVEGHGGILEHYTYTEERKKAVVKIDGRDAELLHMVDHRKLNRYRIVAVGSKLHLVINDLSIGELPTQVWPKFGRIAVRLGGGTRVYGVSITPTSAVANGTRWQELFARTKVGFLPKDWVGFGAIGVAREQKVKVMRMPTRASATTTTPSSSSRGIASRGAATRRRRDLGDSAEGGSPKRSSSSTSWGLDYVRTAPAALDDRFLVEVRFYLPSKETLKVVLEGAGEHPDFVVRLSRTAEATCKFGMSYSGDRDLSPFPDLTLRLQLQRKQDEITVSLSNGRTSTTIGATKIDAAARFQRLSLGLSNATSPAKIYGVSVAR